MNRPFAVRLGDVAEINPKASRTISDDDAVAFVPMAAVSEEGRLEHHETRPYREVRKGYSYFERGDVLIAKITPCFENGKAALTSDLREQVGFGSTEFHVLRPGPNLDAKYLFYALWNERFRVSAASGMTGSAGQKRVPADLLRRTEIRLPPLDEQQRIAAILDKADALRQKRKLAITLLDSLTQSIFLEMFGDPKRDTERWHMVPFDAACVDETSKSEKLQRSEFRPSGRFPVIDQGQSFIGGWTDEDLLCRSTLPVVVFGDHTRVVKFVKEPFVVGADGAKVLSPTPRFDVLFFSWLLRLMPLPNLGYSRHMRELKRMSFWAPPINVQREFAAKARKIEAWAAPFGGQLNRLEDAFASLQHRAFSGQL